MTFRKWFYRNIYLHTLYWKMVRRIVSKRAHYICEAKGCTVTGHNLDVHHTTYDIMWLEWFFRWKMVYLCRKHHDMTHDGTWMRLKNKKILPPFGYKP